MLQVVALLDRASTPEQWEAMGRQFFDAGQFESATLCYERAGNTTRATQSKVGRTQNWPPCTVLLGPWVRLLVWQQRSSPSAWNGNQHTAPSLAIVYAHGGVLALHT